MTTPTPELMPDEYYLQNKDARYLGNAPVWWAKGGRGYTAYILGAERFRYEAAEKYVRQDPDKFAMYKCADIDARLHLVFDCQDFGNLGTDKPCGWRSGYAALASTDLYETLRKKYAALKEVAETSQELIDFIMKKYGVSSVEEFTCPIHRKLFYLLTAYQAHKEENDG